MARSFVFLCRRSPVIAGKSWSGGRAAWARTTRSAFAVCGKEYNQIFKDAEADKEISEDDLDRYLKQVQKSTDEYSSALDSLVSAKEAEIVEV